MLSTAKVLLSVAERVAFSPEISQFCHCEKGKFVLLSVHFWQNPAKRAGRGHLSTTEIKPNKGIAVDTSEKRRHMTHTPLPAKGCCCERLDQSPGLRIVLLPAPSQPYDQWLLAGFVPVHSCGAAPDLHRLP